MVASAGGAAALIVGALIAQGRQRAGYDASAESVSVLAAADTAHRWTMTVAFALAGLGLVVTSVALPGMLRRARAVLALAGSATLAAAALPLPSASVPGWAHLAAASVALVALAVWPWIAARDDAHPTLRPGVVRLVSPVLFALVATLPVTARLGAGYGTHERIALVALVIWPVVVAVDAWWAGGRHVGTRPVARALALGVATVCCAGAGVLATLVWPTVAQTDNFRAVLTLSPDPRDASTLRVVTVFGDVVVDFAGVAPGIRATPQVKASIADLLARPGASLSTLRPSDAELDAAVSGAVRRMALSFAVGALVGAATWVGLRALARRGRPPWRGVAEAGLAWVLASAIVGSAVWDSYRPGRQQTFTTTSVLSTVQNNAGLFRDLEARSTQATPYLRNLIVISSALQDRYRPENPAGPAALKVLLVSDLHAADYYTLMRSIVVEEQIDLVVDSGDLVNFGTVDEGELAGMFEGIATLGVPYLFVRGNHDATSPEDAAVLSRLGRIPNVILLQPNATTYTEVDVHGVRISGFNDPRFWGDDGIGDSAKQASARDQWLRTFAQRPTVDLLVSHEPWAVAGIGTVGVAVNGHMHSSDVEGNRIQVGTFTGGGPVSHYISAPGAQELQGQPSAFDVLTFGQTCRLGSVVRYRYRNIIEGHPAYDDVSLLNGSRIDTRPADPLRRCSADQPLRQISVAAIR